MPNSRGTLALRGLGLSELEGLDEVPEQLLSFFGRLDLGIDVQHDVVDLVGHELAEPRVADELGARLRETVAPTAALAVCDHETVRHQAPERGAQLLAVVILVLRVASTQDLPNVRNETTSVTLPFTFELVFLQNFRQRCLFFNGHLERNFTI